MSRLKRVLIGLLALAPIAHGGAAVRTEPVSRGDITGVVTSIGVLQPVGVVEVGPQLAATLLKWGPGADYRSHVQEGEVLAQLDDSFLRVQLEQDQAHARRATAEVEQARVKVQTADPRKPDDARVARSVLDVAEASLAEAQAMLKETKLNVDAARVTAPIKGSILDRRGEIGQAVGPNLNGPAMFSIWPDGDRMQVWAEVDETRVAEINAGQAAQFTCAALPGKLFRGKVAKVRLNAARLREAVRYTVEVDVEKSDAPPLPYLSADVRIVTAEHRNVLLVPIAALEWLPQSELLAAMRRQASPMAVEATAKAKTPRVWMLNGTVARPIDVKLGATDGHKTQITGGDLKEGDQVIVEGSMP